MTFEELADFLVDRWGNSQRISMRGRAIVISKTELEMIAVALRGGGALRSLAHPSHNRATGE